MQGFVLIAVAGMEYAAMVESRGFDVLTSSGMKAAQSLKKSIEEISKQVERFFWTKYLQINL